MTETEEKVTKKTSSWNAVESILSQNAAERDQPWSVKSGRTTPKEASYPDDDKQHVKPV